MPRKALRDELVPVFIPPLAKWLAGAEKVKGKPLTETEVARIRDKSPCIMMESKDAAKLTRSRGYRDVNPETCWSDWHRLRVQMTGNGYLPRIVLCIVGGRGFERKCAPLLEAENIEHEFRGRDRRMVAAFEASASPAQSSLDAKDFARIRKHDSVLYCLSSNFTAQEALQVSSRFLDLGARLLDAGGIAMKCESSGIAHARSRWFELASKAPPTGTSSKSSRGAKHRWPALFEAYVQMPIRSDDDLHSCGMHLLGQPDLIVAHNLAEKVFDRGPFTVNEVLDLFYIFAVYLLTECQPGDFGTRHTFQCTNDSPRFRLRWEKCTGYDEDEYFFNPFGRWRFQV